MRLQCDLNLTSYQTLTIFTQSLYPKEAFEWENLILCCQVCNISKANRFPVDENGKPLLINPSNEDPDKHIKLDQLTGLLNG
jgi:5-methylcytosine-specific restriction endonuclease McrA